MGGVSDLQELSASKSLFRRPPPLLWRGNHPGLSEDRLRRPRVARVTAALPLQSRALRSRLPAGFSLATRRRMADSRGRRQDGSLPAGPTLTATGQEACPTV